MKSLCVLLLVLLVACDSLLGFHPAKLRDAGPSDAPSDTGSGGPHVCVFDTTSAADQFDNGCVFGP